MLPDIRFHPSASKHGVPLDQALHALRFPLYHGELKRPTIDKKYLVIGSDYSGKLLEIIYLFDKDKKVLVIHIMKCRTSYFHLLAKGDRS